MNISFSKKVPAVKHKKDGRVDPHRFWVGFMTISLMVFIVELVVLTYFFVIISRRLDTIAVPALETNGPQIRSIEESLRKTQEALLKRTQKGLPSQNNTSIVQ